jgi:hypothetical protein
LLLLLIVVVIIVVVVVIIVVVVVVVDVYSLQAFLNCYFFIARDSLTGQPIDEVLGHGLRLISERQTLLHALLALCHNYGGSVM